MEMPSAITKDYLNGWLEDKKDTTAKKTFEKYQNVAARFLDFLKGKSEQPLSMVSTSDIRNYLREVKETRAASTANNHLKVLRSVFKRAYEKERVILDNPAMGIEIFKHEKYERQPFTKAQLASAFKHACNDWKAIISLGLFTGQRIRDICNLRWSQIDFEHATIAFKTEKTGRRVILPLVDHPLRALNALPRSGELSDPVFPELFGKTSGLLSNRFRKIMERAGLVERRTHRKRKQGRSGKRELGLSFHCLRHTLTSWGKQSGISGPVMQDIVGHDSEAVSREYTHIDLETKRVALNSIENPFEDDIKSKVAKLKA